MTILGVPLADAAAVVTIVSGIIAIIAFVIKEKKPTIHIIVVILIVVGVIALLKTQTTSGPEDPPETPTPTSKLESNEPDAPATTPGSEPCDDKSFEVIIAEANELFSKVWDEWTGYNDVNTSEHNYYVDNGDLVWIIDRTECWVEYYYIDGEVRFALIKEDKYSTDAIRLYFYCGELKRMINFEKIYIHAEDDSEEFEEMKIYAEKAASVYSNAMSYIQRFEPEALE